MSYKEEIDKLDQQIADMNTAKLRATELNKRPGDYDLSTATQAAADDRKAKEAAEVTINGEVVDSNATSTSTPSTSPDRLKYETTIQQLDPSIDTSGMSDEEIKDQWVNTISKENSGGLAMTPYEEARMIAAGGDEAGNIKITEYEMNDPAVAGMLEDPQLKARVKRHPNIKYGKVAVVEDKRNNTRYAIPSWDQESIKASIPKYDEKKYGQYVRSYQEYQRDLRDKYGVQEEELKRLNPEGFK